MDPTAKALNLSPAMSRCLAQATVSVAGGVRAYVRNASTRRALCRRGAVESEHSFDVELDLPLAIAAVEAAEDAPFMEQASDYIAWQLEVYGKVDSNYARAVTAECWRRVRRGELVAHQGEVTGWGVRHLGWVFSPAS